MTACERQATDAFFLENVCCPCCIVLVIVALYGCRCRVFLYYRFCVSSSSSGFAQGRKKGAKLR